MKRDPKFEIQFLISLAIATFGFLSASQFSHLLDQWLAFIFLSTIFLHILLFSVAYTYGTISGFNLFITESLKESSRLSFGVVTGLFLMFLLHIISNSMLELTGLCSLPGVDSFIFGHPLPCPSVAIFISYVVPLLLTVTFGSPIAISIFNSYGSLSDIDIVVVPREVRVHSDLETTEPIFAKIANKSESPEKFDIKVDVPGQVEWRKNHNETGSGDFEETAEIDPKHRYTLDLQLKYTGSHRRSEVLEIEFIHEAGSQTREVELLLDPVN